MTVHRVINLWIYAVKQRRIEVKYVPYDRGADREISHADGI